MVSPREHQREDHERPRGVGEPPGAPELGGSRPVDHAAGKEITEEGGSATGFHLIRTGTASVTVGGQPRAGLGPGQYFGEISLIDGKPRSATVTADGPLQTISLASWSFKPILDEQPGVARALLVVMCERLRRAEH